LGIDPGLNNVGWAVLKDEETLMDYGCIENEKKIDPAEKLEIIHEEIGKLVEKYKPEVVAIEGLFFAKNKKSALKVAEAMGAIKTAARERGAKIKVYTPLQVKMAVVGYGRADKDQVLDMVQRILGIEEKIEPDHAADAVAVGLTHLMTVDFSQALGDRMKV